VLPSGNRSWWQFWGGGELPPAQIATVLKVLRSRRTPEVLERARQLAGHSDAAVASAAGALLRG
jgi:hypothetical protein